MAKIDSWLDDYIEKFYNDKALRNKILTMSMKGRKEADELLATNCPHYQKKKMKETLANELRGEADSIRRRRNRGPDPAEARGHPAPQHGQEGSWTRAPKLNF